MVARDLITDTMGVGSANVKPLADAIVKNNGNELQSLSAFSFTGGAGNLGFEEDVSKSTEHDSGSAIVFSINAGLDIQIKANIGPFGTKTKLKFHFQHDQEIGDDTADGTDHGYGRSFSLGDDTEGDQFDVQV